MAYHLQLARGNTAKINSFVGKVAELVYNIDDKHTYLHDGTTSGGFKVANIIDIPTKVSQLENDSNYAIASPGTNASINAIYDNAGHQISTYYAPIAGPSLKVAANGAVPRIDSDVDLSASDNRIVTAKWVLNTPNVVRTYGAQTVGGNKTFTGVCTFSQTIQGTAVRANWADLAEYYYGDVAYPCGTLVKFGGEKEITIADTDVNAVVTSTPALVMNTEIADQQHVVCIALEGRVPVLVKGKVNKFDYIGLCETENGIGEVTTKKTKAIARALESNDDDGIKLVLCVVKMRL